MLKFTLTEDHIKLLENTYIEWGDGKNGAPAVDCKRPYGNSNVAYDVAEILGWKLNLDEENCEELSSEQLYQADKIHRETETALQIILQTKSFIPGNYEKEKTYLHSAKWRLV
jgi:hypothetical protein